MGLANYFEGDPSFTEPQETELIRLAQALRETIDHCVKLNAPLETLTAIASQAEQLAQRMAPFSQLRPMAAHNKVFRPERVDWSAPYSPVVGRCNPLSPPMCMRLEHDKAIGEVTFGDAYEGPPGCVHGGMVSLTWDHVLALSNMLLNARGPTAWLHVEYRKPTPLLTPLRFEAWIDKVEGKKIFAKGVCYANGEVVTEASGLFINTVIKNIGVTEEVFRQHTRFTPLSAASETNEHTAHPTHFTAD